jgi:hypothetical protein
MLLHPTPYCGVGVGHWHFQVHPPPHAWTWSRTHFSKGCPTTEFGFCTSPPEDCEAQFRFVVCVSSLFISNLFAFLSSNFWYRHVLMSFVSLPLCAESKLKTLSASLMRTCSLRLRLRLSFLPMLLRLPIFWRKHFPHLLVAPAPLTT